MVDWAPECVGCECVLDVLQLQTLQQSMRLYLFRFRSVAMQTHTHTYQGIGYVIFDAIESIEIETSFK